MRRLALRARSAGDSAPYGARKRGDPAVPDHQRRRLEMHRRRGVAGRGGRRRLGLPEGAGRRQCRDRGRRDEEATANRVKRVTKAMSARRVMRHLPLARAYDSSSRPQAPTHDQHPDRGDPASRNPRWRSAHSGGATKRAIAAAGAVETNTVAAMPGRPQSWRPPAAPSDPLR